MIDERVLTESGMKKSKPIIILIIAFSIVILLYQHITSQNNNELSFQYLPIDEENPGQRAVADVDGDGLNDIILAVDFESGKPVGLYWYQYPHWKRYMILSGLNFRADDLEVADIDDDGDVDVVATVDEDGKVYWCENPRPKRDPKTTRWSCHFIGTSGGYVKDVEIGDIDNDGNLDIVTRCHEVISIFKQETHLKWTRVQKNIHKNEGMDIGDIDGDGDLDIVLNGFWLETPNDFVHDNWMEHEIDPVWYTQATDSWQDNCGNVNVADINMDGKRDVILCHSEKEKWPVVWYESIEPKAGNWEKHYITDTFNYCETLQVVDIDNDGDADVVAGEMKRTSKHGDLAVFLNSNNGSEWEKRTIKEKSGIYNGVLGDIGNDGDSDIIGCRDYNKPPLELWKNLNNKSRYWEYIPVDNNRPESQKGKMGLVFADANHDGFADIVAGSFLYINPGGNLRQNWSRIQLPGNIDVYFAIDVDGDQYCDLIGIDKNLVKWIEATNPEAIVWKSVTTGILPSVPDRGYSRTQGYFPAQIIAGGKPELVFTYAMQLYCVEIPEDDNAKGEWRKYKISSKNEEEGVATGDIDLDGDIDIAGYSSDGRNLIWFENPGDIKEVWKQHILGESQKRFDRIAIADINNDRRMDIVTSEETQDWDYNAKVYWFESPPQPTRDKWSRHEIIMLRSINSLSTVDFDNDGDTDIVAAEHTDNGDRMGAPDNLTFVFENQNDGLRWIAHTVEEGPHSSHLGTKVSDLDNDGDYDIVSIGWNQYRNVHLWMNLSRESISRSD